MTRHIFFSWQSDTPTAIGRNFILKALEDAVAAIGKDADVNEAVRNLAVDRDSNGVSGSPPIVDTIFGKIDDATAFISDLTYVGRRLNGGGIPNPNVLLEHGWALKGLTWRRVLAVMNVAFGHPETVPLPFDLRHFLGPIFFSLTDEASLEERAEERRKLTRAFTARLKALLIDDTLSKGDQLVIDPREEQARAILDEFSQDQIRGLVPVIVTRPRLTLRIVPLAAAEHRRLDPRRVAEAQLRFPPNVNMRVATDADTHQWWSADPPKRTSGPNPESSWSVRLVRLGAVEYQRTVGAYVDDDDVILIDGRAIEREIVETIERLGAALAGLDLGGPALVAIALDGVEDVELTRARPGGRRIRTHQVHLPLAFVSDVGHKAGDSLQEQFDILWYASGWTDGSPSYETGGWQLPSS